MKRFPFRRPILSSVIQVALYFFPSEKKEKKERKTEKKIKKRKSIGSLVELDNYCALEELFGFALNGTSYGYSSRVLVAPPFFLFCFFPTSH